MAFVYFSNHKRLDLDYTSVVFGVGACASAVRINVTIVLQDRLAYLLDALVDQGDHCRVALASQLLHLKVEFALLQSFALTRQVSERHGLH